MSLIDNLIILPPKTLNIAHMKKIIVLIGMVYILFSCNSNDDPLNLTKTQTYDFTLKAKSEGRLFVSQSPLKSLGDTAVVLQAVVYKESGEKYSSTTLNSDDLLSAKQSDGSVNLSFKLPKGNYHVALAHYYSIPSSDGDMFTWIPNNYYSDTIRHYGATHSTSQKDANVGLYFETLELAVPNELTSSITLLPMWSTVSITFSDVNDFVAPDGANYLVVDIEPYTEDLSVATKLAKKVAGRSHNAIGKEFLDVNTIKNLDKLEYKFNVSKTTEQDNRFILKLKFYKNPDFIDAPVFERTFDLDPSVQNAIHYIVTGKLGETTEQSFSVKLGEFTNQDIEL